MNPTAVTASFDRAARSYERHAAVQTAMAAWLAEWLPPDTGRAIEIGAGTGLFTRHLVGHARSVVATDAAPAMVAAGRAAVPGAEWRTMRAEAPLPGPWDGIYSSSMLQWATSPAEMLRGWREVLAPGGRVLTGLFAADSLPELRALGVEPPLVWRTPAEWREAVARAGLWLCREETDTRVFRHASALELFRMLHGLGSAPARRLTAGGLRRLLREYETRFGCEGGVGSTWTFYRFEAESQ